MEEVKVVLEVKDLYWCFWILGFFILLGLVAIAEVIRKK
jgi:hypothetical protein